MQLAATQESGGPRQGLSALLTAFSMWGLMPLYLRPLHAVPAAQITAHRVVWCCMTVLCWLGARASLPSVRAALVEPRTRARLLASACLISINWLLFVWSIGSGRVVESSLGYFINPLVNVLLGVLVLRERLNRAQVIAVGIAAVGVAYLTVLAGRPPWLALVLALSFGGYGLIRKLVAVDAMTGLAAETVLIAPFGVGYLLYCELTGQGAFGHLDPLRDGMLVLGGPLTAVPLWLFAYGARRVRYSTVGLIQYLAPSLQLLFGIFIFREPFTATTAVGYALIWCALALYAADSILRAAEARQQPLKP